MCDLEDERRYEERQDDKQAKYRVARGVGLCPNCNSETRTVIWCTCGRPFAGCSACMHFDEGYNDFFCGPDCSRLKN